MSEFVTVAKVGDIPDGEGRAFEVDEQMVAVFNRGGEYFAIDDMCPHMGASLAAGYFEPSDCTVTCPWHAWRFDTRDGTWCDNRRLKIDAYQVRVEADEIQVAPLKPDDTPGPGDTGHEEADQPADQDPSSGADVSISHPAEGENGES